MIYFWLRLAAELNNLSIEELGEFQRALKAGDNKKLERLLIRARERRARLIEDKLRKRELIS